MPRKDSSGNKDGNGTKGSSVRAKYYDVNSRVLCRHLDNLYYEAKIINVEHSSDGEPVYLVHYQGWNQRHDEKIAHSSTVDRFLEHTPANLEKAKTEMKDAQTRLAQNKKRNRKSTAADEKKSGGADSRSSTPSDKRNASSSRAASTISEKSAIALTTVRKRKSGVNESVEPIPDFVRKKEIKIDISNVLKDLLVDDHDMIIRQMYLARLPARFTVTEIIRQYADYMGTCVEDRDTLNFEYSGDDKPLKGMMVTLIESSYGIQDYFNSTLGSQLLYKFERPQYSDLVEKHKTKEEGVKDSKRKKFTEVSGEGTVTDDKFKTSDFYGFIHLLRLFVRFGRMLGLTSWDDRVIQTIVNHVHNFLKFLEVNRHKFFDLDLDYEIAPPEYQRRVWSS